MAKKVTLYSIQHPTKGKAFEASHAERMLAVNNGGWFENPLKEDKENGNRSPGAKKKAKKTEE